MTLRSQVMDICQLAAYISKCSDAQMYISYDLFSLEFHAFSLPYIAHVYLASALLTIAQGPYQNKQAS